MTTGNPQLRNLDACGEDQKSNEQEQKPTRIAESESPTCREKDQEMLKVAPGAGDRPRGRRTER